ncbi:hypothetical protein CBI38_07520 [Rhodococcus oxybenzonivorans]|uniref:Secreted protein n=1 Tax=Rhodococcus oxybenzonivorans TaxID=1990687 RepID=A0A2S2BSB7_9NOCA|nr:hypothetical protein CBI38_07520 [Rhodococcus oxybenzonivorans]
MTHTKSAVYLLLLPIFASFSSSLANFAKKEWVTTYPVGEERYPPVVRTRRSRTQCTQPLVHR